MFFTVDDFNMCLVYFYLNKIKEINDNLLKTIKDYYNIYTFDNFINKEINRQIYYFKSYERAFNYRFLFDKQYLLFRNGYSGTYKNWTNYGEIVIEFYHINGKIEGILKKGDIAYNYIDDEPIDGGINTKDLIMLDHFMFDYE